MSFLTDTQYSIGQLLGLSEGEQHVHESIIRYECRQNYVTGTGPYPHDSIVCAIGERERTSDKCGSACSYHWLRSRTALQRIQIR